VPAAAEIGERRGSIGFREKLRTGVEIVQAGDARYHRRQRFGNLRVGAVGPMLFAVDGIPVDRSAKCPLDGGGGA
jgi:hypothetical protein